MNNFEDTNMVSGQLSGCSSLSPFSSFSTTSDKCHVGYGVPPRVMSSKRSTPNDHLKAASEDKTG